MDSGDSLKFKTENNIIQQSLEETKNENTNNSKNLQFTKDILLILLNFKLGEKEFFDKVENSKNNIIDSINNYYLINSDTFSQFIQFFSLQKIENLFQFYKLKSISDIKEDIIEKMIKENKIFLNRILNLKEDFLKKFQLKKFFDIKSNKYGKISDFKIYNYPSEFQIVSKNVKEKLCEIFGDKIYNNVEEISLGFITGNVIFKPNKGRFFDSNKNFAYIYSLTKEINGFIRFFPEILIGFNANNSMIN